MTTNARSSQSPKLLEFYERNVLPSLFEQLDEAFPEFQWTRVDGGWSASRNPFSSDRNVLPGQISCRQPWGFVADEGTTISWLAYANGGRRPVEYEIVSAVRRLADLARVDDSSINRAFTAEEIREAHRTERRSELFEAFAAYCHVVLLSQEGHAARERVRRTSGLDWQQLVDSSLGLYTSCADVHDYLASMGFSPDEIHDSKITRDVRLDGRILIPWRDSCGQLRSFVACSVADGKGEQSGRLYLNGRGGQDAFGADVALRPESGGKDDLVLVESILDVVHFHSLGLTNVVSFGVPGRVPDRQQWERLADQGVTKVTLAFDDDTHGRQRAFETICEANRARRCPELFVVPPDSFASARGPVTFTRLHGLGQFRHHVDRRIHAYHFIAQALVRRRRPGPQWTDGALVEVLNDAIRFDAATYLPERAVALDRFFWPYIVKATGADWEAIRGLLARGGRRRRNFSVPPRAGELLDHTQLLHDLTDCHDARRIDEFQALICAAADAIQSWKPREPRDKADKPAPRVIVMPHRRRRPSRPPHDVEVPRIVPIRHPAAVKWPRTASSEKAQSESPKPEVIPDVPTVAYQLWEKKGRPDDADQQCWYEAERLVAEALARRNRQRTKLRRDWKSAA